MNTPSASPRLIQMLLKLWSHLSHRRRVQFALLIALMLLSAFAEVISLGAVLPFLGILITPDVVFNHPFIASIMPTFGITSPAELVLPLTVFFVFIAVVAGVIRMLFMWISTRLAYISAADLSIEVYRRTLYQPYQVHTARNSSEVIGGITGKVNAASNMLFTVLMFVSSIVLLISIISTLIVIDPVVALVSSLIFGVFYGIISGFARKKLRRNSSRIAQEHTQVLKALNEGLGGIRDVLLNNTQDVYCDIYRRSDFPLRQAQGNNQFISSSPRFAMEAIGIALIAVLAYFLSLQSGGIAKAIPILGALALGAQRLLPALQQIYSSWSSIIGNQASLVDALALLEQPMPEDYKDPIPEPMAFEQSIQFKDVKFRYTDDTPWILNELNISIPKGARIGIVGKTGSGKSTTMDLLLGLLSPSAGRFLVDGILVTGRQARSWQQTIAHVPQAIYLSDASMAENIAFGIPFEAIDLERVKKAACQAQIDEFIESQPDGYGAHVGERGIRISGGQRQRIGIARAFYKQASVLVFDEATSALDNATEQSVMEAIDQLDRHLTIIIIAHRLTTVQNCDSIIELDNGRIVAQGSYEELMKISPSFRQMTLVSH